MKSASIDSFRFGQIAVAGQIYTSDLILLPERILPNWWRKSGHRLAIEDLAAVLQSAPEILIIGQGTNSRMLIPKETWQALAEARIEVLALPTPEACQRYNHLCSQHKVAAALHLTC